MIPMSSHGLPHFENRVGTRIRTAVPSRALLSRPPHGRVVPRNDTHAHDDLSTRSADRAAPTNN